MQPLTKITVRAVRVWFVNVCLGLFQPSGFTRECEDRALHSSQSSRDQCSLYTSPGHGSLEGGTLAGFVLHATGGTEWMTGSKLCKGGLVEDGRAMSWQ